MNEMEKLQYVLFERLHRRAPGIDKLDRLWDAAVLLALSAYSRGISVLVWRKGHIRCAVSRVRCVSPAASTNVRITASQYRSARNLRGAWPEAGEYHHLR